MAWVIEHGLAVGLAEIDQLPASQTVNSRELPHTTSRCNTDLIGAESHQRYSQQPGSYASRVPSPHLVRELQSVADGIDHKEGQEQNKNRCHDHPTDDALGPEVLDPPAR
jgi:hypothetical protein